MLVVDGSVKWRDRRNTWVFALLEDRFQGLALPDVADIRIVGYAASLDANQPVRRPALHRAVRSQVAGELVSHKPGRRAGLPLTGAAVQ